MTGDTHAIAVDWGTSRFRAWRIDGAGRRLDQVASDEGIAAVPPGGFGAVLMARCGAWLAADPTMPVLMAGMVGSRNGWIEVPYATCPTDVIALARDVRRIARPDGGVALIVPGVTAVFDDAADVMRGEETLAFGLGRDDARVCLPGTHSKWVVLQGGRIERFATFMTGELYGAALGHTILGRLAEAPEDEAGFARGLDAVGRPGGLTHQLFAARADVLAGRMAPAQVAPFLSGLLIGHEVSAARSLSGDAAVDLVADGAVAARYAMALERAGLPARVAAPADCLVAGLRRILEHAA
jgi:2-dehydro-3-deoxygalactonokinase